MKKVILFSHRKGTEVFPMGHSKNCEGLNLMRNHPAYILWGTLKISY